MWEVVERTQVAAAPGRVRQVLDEVERHRDEPGREWWFTVSPSWQGTELEHGCRAADGTDAAGLREIVRAEIVATLADVKARAERA